MTPPFASSWKALVCPPTYDTAALYSQEIDVNYNNVGNPVIDLFDCSAFTGVTAALAPTTFYSWVAIETHDGSMTYASTVAAYVDLTTSDKSFNATIYDDGGYFELAWTLVGGTSGTPLHCSDVTAIHGVESVSTDTASGSQAIVDKFNCTDHYGVTAVLPEGDYTISVDAFDSNNASIGTAPAIPTSTIQGPNKVTNLGTVTIPIDNL